MVFADWLNCLRLRWPLRSRSHLLGAGRIRRRKTIARQIERLDQRIVLSSAQPAAYDVIAPQWFDVVAPGSSSTTGSESGTSGAESVDTEWIVRLTADALASVTSVEESQRVLDVGQLNFQVVQGLGLPGLVLVRASGGTSTEISAALAANPQVSYFERNSDVQATALPNDPLFAQQTELNRIGATTAWGSTTGSSPLVVAVVDSGIDYTSPDLYLNIWLNQGEIPDSLRNVLIQTDTDGLITFRDLNSPQNAGLVPDLNGNGYIDAGDLLQSPTWMNHTDDDNDGKKDDLIGWDFTDDDAVPFDENGHGTHVSGILAATGNNGTGISGVNWSAQIMVVKFLDKRLHGDASQAMSALNYVTQFRQSHQDNNHPNAPDVRISNNSWEIRSSASSSTQALKDVIAANAQSGMLLIAAAGNGVGEVPQDLNTTLFPSLPAAYTVPSPNPDGIPDLVVSVAAVDATDHLLVNSNYGSTTVDLAAPGLDILSTEPGGNYGTRTGTSMATPFVTGTAALFWARFPQATAAEVKQALLNGVDQFPSLTGKVFSGGRLNIQKTLGFDTISPRSTLVSAPDITSTGSTPETITVKYVDNVAVKWSTLDGADLLVTRADGHAFTITLQSTSVSVDAAQIVATYQLLAPSGKWTNADNGDYVVSVVPNQVTDTVFANKNLATVLGTFKINIPAPDDMHVTSVIDSTDNVIGDGVIADAQGLATLRAAIQEANFDPDANTINLVAGTYNLAISGVNELFAARGDFDLRQNVTIVGVSAASTIIDASGLDRIFHVFPGVTVTLKNLTLRGGNATDAKGGGAILNEGNLTLDHVIVTSNAAASPGGGGVLNQGFLNLQQAQILFNTAPSGGGILNNNTTAPATTVTLEIDDSTISGNLATGDGGGLRVQKGKTLIQRSTFDANVAQGSGGGLAVQANTTTVTNATFSANTATTGGGLAAIGGSLTISYSTITLNSASTAGGGLSKTSGTTSLTDTIVAGNFSTDGNARDISSAAAFISNGHNLIGVIGSATGFSLGQGDLIGTSIIPIDPNLAPLAYNGGPTRTHRPNIGSLVIDHGATDANTPQVDQRGFTRVVDGDDSGSATIDIGAVEFVLFGTISGTAYYDANQNGVFDSLEQPLAGWTIFLDANANQILDVGEWSTISGTDGRYSFKNVPPGDYIVTEILKDSTAATNLPSIVQDFENFDSLATPVNVAPVAFPQALSTNEDSILTTTLFGDDGDPEVTQTLTFTIETGPAHGTLFGFNALSGAVNYIAAPNFSGPDSFTFSITDDNTAGGAALTSIPVTVWINVLAVNDLPLADSQTRSNNGTNRLITLTGSDGDPDFIQATSFAIVTYPAHGTLNGLNPITGEVTYIPSPTYKGADSFTFSVTDDNTAGGPSRTSAPATVTLTPDFPTNPYAVATGDLNGDGISDIVTANSSDTVSVLLGYGDGTFYPKHDYPTGSFAISVSIADLNNDGKLDLITANPYDGTVSVLRGIGDGTFQAKTDYAAGYSPQSVAVADVNVDSVPDILTVNLNSNVSVLLGNGDGTFQAKTDVPTPGMVIVGDLTEGNASAWTTFASDSAAASVSNDTTHVMVGTQSLKFTTQSGFDTGIRMAAPSGHWDLTQAYFLKFWAYGENNTPTGWQGNQPIVVLNSPSGSLRLEPNQQLMSNGDWTKLIVPLAGDFVWQVTQSGTFNRSFVTSMEIHQDTWESGFQIYYDGIEFDGQTTTSNSLKVADVDGDAKPDLITTNYGSNSVSVLLGKGDGTFQSQQDFATGAYPFAVAISDINGDAKPDLVTANVFADNVSVLLGLGNGAFQAKQDFSTGFGPASVALADMNNDGISDIVTANYFGNSASLLLGNGNGTFQSKTDLSTGLTPRSVAITSLKGNSGALYFSASDAAGGRELWKSDGTAAGTVLVKDIRPGTSSSFPVELTNVNGTVFFNATDGLTGPELWKSDGTAAGTVLVKDIKDGSSGSVPTYLTAINGTLYFAASEGAGGNELWKSDGTSAGTVQVKDIFAGIFSSNPRNLINVNGTLFFTAADNGGGIELWKSDGTTAGTVQVKDIVAGTGNSSPASLTNVNGVLYFTATDTAGGTELWKSDGTSAGTVQVKDIVVGSGGSAPASLTNVNGTLYFTSNDGSTGVELWKSNGTAAGTIQVKDIVTGSGSSSPGSLTNVNGVLYFTATDAAGGTELWKSDGTSAGTTQVKDILAGTGSSSPSGLKNVSSILYFAAADGSVGSELWKTNGTALGTTLVKDIFSGSTGSSPNNLQSFSGTLYFSATDAAGGTELWKSDGTAAGTVRVSDIAAGSTGSAPLWLTSVPGKLDLVTANQSGESVSVFLGHGNGTFDSRVDYSLANASANSPPQAADVSISVFDNQATMFMLPATDPDGNALTYALKTSPSHGSASVNQLTGQATYTPSGTYVGVDSFTYTVTDSVGASSTATVTLTITHLNQAPTDIALSATSIPENNSPNATVGTLSATDPDPGNTFSFSLASGTGSTDNGSFLISGTSLKIIPTAHFGTQSTYLIRVRVTDQDGLTYDKPFTINITSVNSTKVSLAKIQDGAETGSPVQAKFRVTQSAVSAVSTTVHYSVGGTATPGIDFTTLPGTITIPAGSITADINVAVLNDNIVEGTETITLVLTSVDGAADVAIAPNLNVETNFVGTYSPDTWSFVSAPAGSVSTASAPASISLVSGNTGTLSDTSYSHSITADGTLSFNWSYTTSDGANYDYPLYLLNGVATILPGYGLSGSTSQSGTLQITVHAGDTFGFRMHSVDGIFGAATIVFSNFIVTSSSNGASQSAVSSITDDDSATVSISKILDGGETSPPTNGKFRVTLTTASSSDTVINYSVDGTATSGVDYNGLSGQVTILAGQTIADIDVVVINDVLAESTETVGVTLTGFGAHDADITLDSNSANRTATVTIANVLTLNSAPTNITLSGTSITENNAPNLVVATLSATDSDSGDTFSFSLAGGAGSVDNGSFSILGNTLVINSMADFETQSSYAIRIRVTDQGGLSFEKPFTISVVNANEAPTISGIPNQTLLKKSPPLSFLVIVGDAETPADNLNLSVSSSNQSLIPNSSLAFSGSGSLRSLILVPSADQTGTAMINISVTDTGGMSSFTSFTVEVVNSSGIGGLSVPNFPAGWSVAGNVAWVTVTGDSSSSPNHAFVPDSAGTSDSQLTSPSIVITQVHPQLKFQNSYNTEAGTDGGVLEVSVNGGAFNDILAAGGSFVTGGYNSTITTGRSGWSGSSSVFNTTLVNLPESGIGSTLQFRWRFLSNSSTGGTGWNIDTIQLLGKRPIWETIYPGPALPTPGRHQISVTPGANFSNLDFGNYANTGEIHGREFVDSDGNGKWSPLETPLSGWKVFLDQNENGILDANELFTLTAPDGTYTFTNVPAQTRQIVTALVPAGWAPTTFPAEFTSQTLTAQDGFAYSDLSENHKLGTSVSGAGDINGDGFDDFLVGRPAVGNGSSAVPPTSFGYTYVVFGGPAGLPANFSLLNLDGSNGFAILAYDAVANSNAAGSTVAAAGDINHDQFGDILIGAPLADVNGTQSGAAYVIFGKAGGYPALIDLTNTFQPFLDGKNGFAIYGSNASDSLGSSVSGVGDVNGDTFDDFVVAAPGVDSFRHSGSAYLIFGRNTQTNPFSDVFELTPSTLNGVSAVRLDGADEDRLGNDVSATGITAGGSSVSAAGDLNGDGVADLIIGAKVGLVPSETSTVVRRGKAYVVFGKKAVWDASINLAVLNGANGFVVRGAVNDDELGISVAGVGDVNGDTFDDVLIGADHADPNGQNSGASYVLFGKDASKSPFTSAISVASLDGTNGFRINGAAGGDEAGVSVSRAGDVNGDGLADLLIGADRVDPVIRSNITDVGAAYVVFGSKTAFTSGTFNLSGLNGQNGFRLSGSADKAELGFSVSGIGDFNGDGLADVLVGGSPQNGIVNPVGLPLFNSGVYLVYGRADNRRPLTLDAAEPRSNVDFGIVPKAAEIRGMVFDDKNGNGLRDSGEPAVPNVSILLDLNDNGVKDLVAEQVVLSDASGQYVFSSLPTSLNLAHYRIVELYDGDRAELTSSLPQRLYGTAEVTAYVRNPNFRTGYDITSDGLGGFLLTGTAGTTSGFNQQDVLHVTANGQVVTEFAPADHPQGVTSDGTYAYWVDRDADGTHTRIYRQLLNGTVRELVYASVAQTDGSGQIIDATGLDFVPGSLPTVPGSLVAIDSLQGQISRLPTTTDITDDLVTSIGAARSSGKLEESHLEYLDEDNGVLYVVDPGYVAAGDDRSHDIAARILSIPLAGGAYTTLFTGELPALSYYGTTAAATRPRGITVHDGVIYVLGQQVIYSLTVSNQTLQPIAADERFRDLASLTYSDDSLYVIDNGTSGAATVWRVNLHPQFQRSMDNINGSTDPTNDRRAWDVLLSPGDIATGLDFARFDPGPQVIGASGSHSISGVVFNDVNNDGQQAQDGSEPGISGVTVFLDKNRNGILDAGDDTTVTFAADLTSTPIKKAGEYLFDGLDPILYDVLLADPNLALALTTSHQVALSPTDLVNSDPETTGTPRTVTIGDWNNDGFNDLIVADSELDTVTLWKNTGDQKFVDVTQLYVSGIPNSVTLINMDGDSLPDLAIGRAQGGHISLWKNLGNDQFQEQKSGGLPKALILNNGSDSDNGVPGAVVSADFNNDTLPDLAVVDSHADHPRVFVFLRTPGDFSFAAPQILTTLDNVKGLVAADLNGDGSPDLAGTVPDLNQLLFWPNLNSGTTRFPATAQSTTVLDGPTDLTVLQANGGGGLDLAIVNAGAEAVTVLANSGTGTWTTLSTLLLGIAPSSIQAANFDGQFGPDLAVTLGDGNDSSQPLVVFYHSGDNTQPYSESVAYGASIFDFNGVKTATGMVLRAGNLDKDNDPDLVVVNSSTKTVSVLRNGPIRSGQTVRLTIDGASSAPNNINFGIGSSPQVNFDSGSGQLTITLPVQTDIELGSVGTQVELRIQGVVYSTLKVAASAITGIVIQGSSGADRIDLSRVSAATGYIHAGGVNVTVNGNAGSDNITGSEFPDHINGNDGQDVLDGRGGADIITGGLGDDFLYGGEGDDTLDGQTGANLLDGGPGNNTLSGGRVNEVPSFVVGLNLQIAENSGPQVFNAWATAISAGPANEAGQAVNFLVSSNNSSLFSVQPSVLANGSLAFTPAANAFGTVTVTVRIHDNGGTANGGVDTSGPQTFTITINQINRAPTDLSLSPSTLAENNAANATVGTLSATDPDSGNTFTYTLVAGNGGADNASFFIPVNTSTLKIIPSADFEAKASYSILVRVTDQGGLTFDKPLTITVSNVNEAPSNLFLSSTTIGENNAPNATVGTLTALDPDGGATFTFSLVSGSGSTDNSNFTIPANTNTLKITPVTSFAAKSSYAIRLRVTDQGGMTFDKSFTINVTVGNQAPTDLTLSATSIAENNIPGAVIGTFSATDPNAGDIFTYTPISGTGSTDNASFDFLGNTLAIKSSTNYEFKNSYSILVRVSDQGGMSFDKQFTILVNNVNEAPFDLSLSTSSIAENNLANAIVGTLIASDPDSGGAFTFSLVAGAGGTDNASFSIPINTNTLKIIPSADFENKNSYSIRVRVTDQGTLSFDKILTVTVNDLNENPTDISLSATSIAENNAPNATVATISAMDPDTLPAFTFSLVSGVGSTDNNSFFIPTNTNLLKITQVASLSSKSSYSIRLRVTDQGGLAFDKAFTINVTPFVDPSILLLLPFDGSLTGVSGELPTASAGTNFTAGQSLQAVHVNALGFIDYATDNNVLAARGTVEFEIRPDWNGNTNTGFAFFKVGDNFNNGMLLAIDGNSNLRLFQWGDDPTTPVIEKFAERGVSVDVSNWVAGEWHHIAATWDGASHQLALYLDGQSIGSISNGVVIDSFSSSYLSIGADTLGLSSAQAAFDDFQISNRVRSPAEILADYGANRNDFAPVLNNLTLSVPENTANGSVVTTLAATDADLNKTFSYSIVAGNSLGIFTINSASGAITIADKTNLNRESVSAVSLSVQVSDGGPGVPRTATANVTINVTDVNEFSPTVSGGPFNVPENSANGSPVGTVSGADSDATNGGLSYSISGGNGLGIFAINPSTGVISVADKSNLDREAVIAVTLTVQVSDNGPGPALTNSTNVTINVTNVNETPTDLTLSANSISENNSPNATIGTLSALDPDVGSEFTFSLVPGAGSTDNSSFTVSGNSLKITPVTNFATQSSYALRLRVTDQGGLSFERPLVINVLKVTGTNIAPTDLSLSVTDIAENNVPNATVGTLAATDPNAGDTFTFSLVVGAGSTDNGTFVISGNSLKISASTDFETRNNYSIRVRVTDQGGLAFEKPLTINVTNVFEAPTDISLSASSLIENNAPNASVGTLGASDSDAGSTFTFSLVGGAGSADNGSFSVSGNSLRIIPVTNFGTQNSYAIRLRVTDQDGLVFEKPFVISVLSGNAAPTDLTLSTTHFPENNVPNATVGTLSAIDPNAGNTFTFSLVAGSGSADNGSFNLSGNVLRFTSSADFETRGSYQIRVRVTDQGGLTFDKPLTINVDDVNELPTISGIANQDIQEDFATAALPFTVGDSETPAVNLTVTPTSSNAALIPNANLELRGTGANRNLVVTPLHNQSGTATITVTVSDGSQSTFQTFLVTVHAVDDPTVITLNSQPLVYSVKSKSIVPIDGTATISDADAEPVQFTGSTLTVSGQSAKDTLSIIKQNGIGLKGKNVLFGTTVIGTFAGGKKAAPLTVRLTAAATQNAVQMLLRSIGFKSVDKIAGPRTVKFQIGNAIPASRQIQVVP
ncbi:MAG: hypothetical protein JWN70_61 [Planctomycetaceae bacterium]|nr:hypothetical protein [Planctomycetaceae bacterium]